MQPRHGYASSGRALDPFAVVATKRPPLTLSCRPGSHEVLLRDTPHTFKIVKPAGVWEGRGAALPLGVPTPPMLFPLDSVETA